VPKTKKPMAKQASHADEIWALARDLVKDADQWMDTENDQLGGAKPKKLLGTPKEQILLDLLKAIKYGMFT